MDNNQAAETAHPMRRGVWLAVLGTGVFAVAGFASAGDPPGFASFHENVLGTSMELRTWADNAEAAREAEERVLAEIDRLSRILSNHDPASAFRRWQQTRGPVAVPAELLDVLVAADAWKRRTGGAFDPAVHGLSQLWAACARESREPTPAERRAALDRQRQPAWRLDPQAGTAERLSDAPLSLDAIAKGFIVETACAAGLAVEGVRGVLLNLGGDLRVAGDVERTIAIGAPGDAPESNEPVALVRLRNRAVATSGNAHRGFRIGDRWYSHIIDSRTGLPAEGVALAAVAAPRSADADALATALNVLPIDEGLRLVESLPDAGCLVVAADGRIVRSRGWAELEVEAIEPADDPKPAAPAFWGDTHELAVTFTINRPEAEAGRYRRPYVAVWVEDREGNPVRNLSLWVSLGGPGPFQWLPDLKRWTRADAIRRKTDRRDMVDAIGQATRPPGTYTVAWNGLDDLGKPVSPGPYVVTIEAAREHGTYQVIRKLVTVGAELFVEELPGNVEIQSATVAYRRRASTTGQ